MTGDEAISFIRRHGVVLESAKGAEPTLAERIAGGPIRGSWWAHPQAHDIFDVIQKARTSRAVLVCGLANGRITYVHRRLWPHFVRLAHRFPAGALDRIDERHLPSGRHERIVVPVRSWLPEKTARESKRLSEPEAVREIRRWLDRYGAAR